MRRLLLIVMLVLLAACGERSPAPWRSTDISGADFGHALVGLSDQHGKPTTLADFRGRAVLLFFGYTACPDVCPTTLARYAELMKALGAQAERVQVLFVTLDPERDTPDKLGAYVTWFHPAFIGLYGDPAATEAAAREFKVFFARSKGSAGTGYTIDHSAGSYAFDPAGRIRLYIKDDVPVDALASDLKRLLAGQ
jgi:protein SCO1/2